jgi:hypothetical protein
MTPAIFVFHFFGSRVGSNWHPCWWWSLSLLIYLSPYHQYLYPYTTYIWGRAGDVFLISFFTFDSFISPTNIYCKCVRAFLGLSCCACFLRLFCLLITFATLLILLSLSLWHYYHLFCWRVVVAWGGGIPSKYPCVMVVIVVVCVSNQSN